MESNVVQKKFKCPQCDYKCGKMYHVKIHIERVHDKIRNHKCTHCDSKFYRKSELNRHESTVHSQIKEYSCKYCDKAFVWKHNMLKHQKRHLIDAQLTCTVCDFEASDKEMLEKHVNGNHSKTSSSPYKNKTSNLKRKLLTPKSKVNQDNLGIFSAKLDVGTDSMQAQKFTCKYCDQQFAWSMKLRKHVQKVHQIGFDNENLSTLDSLEHDSNNTCDTVNIASNDNTNKNLSNLDRLEHDSNNADNTWNEASNDITLENDNIGHDMLISDKYITDLPATSSARKNINQQKQPIEMTTEFIKIESISKEEMVTSENTQKKQQNQEKESNDPQNIHEEMAIDSDYPNAAPDV